MKFNQTNNNIGDVNNNVTENAQQSSKTIFDYFCSWYGAIIAGTASIIGFWGFAWKEWGVWFFGM